MRFASIVLENDEDPTLTLEEIEALFGVTFAEGVQPNTWKAQADTIMFWLSRTQDGTTRLEISTLGEKFRLGDALVTVMRLAMNEFELQPSS